MASRVVASLARPLSHAHTCLHVPHTRVRTLSSSPLISSFFRPSRPSPAVLKAVPLRRLPSTSSRLFSTSSSLAASASASHPSPSPTPPPDATPTELQIHTLLSTALSPTSLSVQDISGGCGWMFSIDVTAEKFKGMRQLEMQRMVNRTLKAVMEEGGWHGVRVSCRAG